MRKFLLSSCVLLMFFGVHHISAQDWYQIHQSYKGIHWAFPYQLDHFSYFDFPEDNQMVGHRIDDENLLVPFDMLARGQYSLGTDSVSFSSDLSEWEKDKYRVFALHVTTNDPDELTPAKTMAKEWVDCYISVDGMEQYPDLSMTGRIRGRGNSTLAWYDKKPYRIKFDVSSKVLGIKKNKDWVLLANYRDVTKMMNTFCFKAAEKMHLPFTTPVRFAELFINGEYRGLYQIAEQVEVGGHRVDISEDGGILLTFDVDDGPGENPGGGDNFWSKVYNMPTAVKFPKDPTSEQLDDIRGELAILESAIQEHNYELVGELMDIPSYIAMIQLQELVYNVELSAPRSVFMFRDKDGKWTMGPAWDWDAGFDFRWSDMTTGHTYFVGQGYGESESNSYRKSLLGTEPYKRNGNYRVPRFFTDMFGNAQFVQQYKNRWAELKDTLYSTSWDETQPYIDGLNTVQRGVEGGRSTSSSPIQRESERWPLQGFDVGTETAKLKRWLQNRMDYLTPMIAAFPEPEETGKTELAGIINKKIQLDKSLGYHQDVNIRVAPSEVAEILGLDESALDESKLDLVPLNSDGKEGSNTAAGKYGAWFDADGNTASFSGAVHVYIESNDLFTWACGCHPDKCPGDDTHTVMMQYRYTEGVNVKLVNVVVLFYFDESGETPVDDEYVRGTITKSYTLQLSSGYTQDVTIEVDKAQVATILGITTAELSAGEIQLVPLNADGSVGSNTAAGKYGAWFDADGDTENFNSWTNLVHVYIESDNLYEWACGCHPDNCNGGGEQHTVTMQYQFTNDDIDAAVNVKVIFTVEGSRGGGWWW